MAGEIIFLGGILNITDPLFHWQLYIWSWVFFTVFAVVIHIGAKYGPWKGYEALWGLYFAFKAESNAAFISGLQLYFSMRSEAFAKCVFNYANSDFDFGPSRIPMFIRKFLFYYPTAFLNDIDWAHALVYKFGHKNMDVEIAKQFQNHEWEEAPSTTIGGIRTDIILDADLWVPPDTPQHKAVEAFCYGWNEAHPDDQIHSYPKFQRLMNEGKVTPPIGVRKEVYIPWVRIDSAFPIAMEDNETAGYKRQAAREMANEEQTSLSKYFLPLLIGPLALAGLIIVMRFMSLPH